MTSYDSDPDDGQEFEELSVTIQNIGGIFEGQMTFSPGVTLLSGENASNKSSFLYGLSGVLGGPTPPVKSDASTGTVRLQTGTDEYYLEVSNRDGGQVLTDVKRVSDQADLCELFVSLDETNPIRQAVVNNADLYDLLMRPVDTAEIEAEIERLKSKKDRLDERLAELDRMEDRLPTLRTRSDNLQQEIDEIETSLREKRDTITKTEPETAIGDAEGDDVLEELKEKRSERETVRNRIRTQRDAIDSLETELEDVIEQRTQLDPADSSADLESVETEIEQLHHQKQELTTTINALSPIVEMNNQLLDDEKDIPDKMKSDELVAELDPTSRTITCWTCGNTVEREQIATQVQTVQKILQEKRNQRKTITDHIRSLEEQKQQLEGQRDEREQLVERKDSIEAEIDRREAQLVELRDQQTTLDDEIETLQAEADDIDGRDDELLDLYNEVSNLEYERGQFENERTDIEEKIERIESELAERDDLEDERDSVNTQLREQRGRIETLERDLVTTFNESMQQVLDMLEYENVERVWIERLAASTDSPSGTEFELHVVRSGDSGAVYEDTIDSLSKSEREVIGLIVALAGYLAHDVANELPVIVIDAIEMLDADRIHGLLDYFSQHTEYVIAAVLPEEAMDLDGTYPTIPTSSFAVES